jgi:LPXTG-site transpeptidase (sortase) family protein
MLDFFRPVPKKRKVKIKGGNGIVFRNLSKKSKMSFHLFNFVFLISLAYFFYLYTPLIKSLTNFYIFTNNESAFEIKTVVEKEEIQVVKEIFEYEINIPKIQATAKVKTKVSPYNVEEYMGVLKNNTVAQAKDSDTPGSGPGSMSYLFAHSTEANINMVRKNAVFYLLEKLEINDEVLINIEDKTYRYVVYDQKIVEAKELQYLNYREENEEIIIMQTCWPLGTNWKRYLVFAKRV